MAGKLVTVTLNLFQSLQQTVRDAALSAACLTADKRQARRNSNKIFYIELCKMIMLNIEIANVISLDVNPERR